MHSRNIIIEHIINNEILELNSDKNIICGCIYRHPKADMGKFIEYLDKYLSKIDNEKKEVFIAGDFNIDLLKLGSLPKYQEFYNTITSYGFYPKSLIQQE